MVTLAAIPSKRDLQTLTKAIIQALMIVIIESEYCTPNTTTSNTTNHKDYTLLTLVNKEILKVVQLFLSKIESMSITGTPDSRKIAFVPTTVNTSTNANGITGILRSSAQEHNGQLYLLLGHLSEALEKIPSQVMKQIEEQYNLSVGNTSTVADSSLSSSTSSPLQQINQLLQQSIQQCMLAVDEVGGRYVLEPNVTLVSDYATTYLYTHLHREAAVSGNKEIECSHTIQNLLKLVAWLVKGYLLIYPVTPALNQAVYEVYIRVIQAYISCSALVRPVSEASRLRALKDLAAIETSLGPLCLSNGISNDHCPIMLEYK